MQLLKKLEIILNYKVSATGKVKYNQKYYISPYKIIKDNTLQFNYLIGYADKIIDYEIKEGKKHKVNKIGEKQFAV